MRVGLLAALWEAENNWQVSSIRNVRYDWVWGGVHTRVGIACGWQTHVDIDNKWPQGLEHNSKDIRLERS